MFYSDTPHTHTSCLHILSQGWVRSTSHSIVLNHFYPLPWWHILKVPTLKSTQHVGAADWLFGILDPLGWRVARVTWEKKNKLTEPLFAFLSPPKYHHAFTFLFLRVISSFSWYLLFPSNLCQLTQKQLEGSQEGGKRHKHSTMQDGGVNTIFMEQGAST